MANSIHIRQVMNGVTAKLKTKEHTNMDEITISKKEITNMVSEGGKMVFKKTAEDELLKLLQLKEDVEKALLEVKEAIFSAGRSVSPDFTGVIGKKVKCVVRKYGDKYKFKEGTNPKFIKETIIRRANSDEIEIELDNTGKLPEGIVENEREERLTIIVRNDDIKTIGEINP